MKTKKLIVAIIMFIAILMITIFTNSVDASSLGYVTITKERTVDGITYKHQLYSNNTLSTKNIWKLVTSTQDGTITNTIPDLYCLRAGLGFTSESPSNTVVQYNQSYSLPEQYTNLVNYFSTLQSETTIFDASNSENFNAVMWILDNMLLENATDTQVENYLKTYAGYTDRTLNSTELKENVLSRADIEAIQQLAIWYFTNNDEEAYNKETLPTLYMTIAGDGIFDTEEYKTFADIFNTLESYGTQRQNAAATLYSSLITKAKAAAQSGTYSPSRKITVYLAGTDAASEQPVVRVEEAGEIDVVLRKFISSIDGENLTGENSRAPIVDTSELNKVIDGELQTTAKYNHPKTPLKVSVGNTVTYTLRLYNEGDEDAYIKEVTDYLPAYLEYTAYGDDEGIWWLLDEATGRIATTTDFCKVVGVGGNIAQSEIGKNLGDVLIPAAQYNEATDDYTLSYIDIQISCTVMPTTPYDTKVTNVAEITGMADKNGTPIDQERDSVAGDNMTLPNDDMLPEYTGGANEKDDPYYDGTNIVDGTYYPGQEDDDDFEKIIIETPEIDLALRKFISAVGDTAYDRAPSVDTSGLRQGAETAIYNHSKVPVEVEIGDVVTYTIRLYNEGEVNARVSQVTDYLDSHLKYVPFGDDTNGDWWSATSGNGYTIVTSTDNCIVVNVGGDTNTSYVGGKLSDAIIPAYDKTRDVLSYVDIEIHCQVMAVDEPIKLTNIAEITGQTDENGTPVDTDRDSTPGNVELPEAFPGYKDDEIGKDYIPGQQDDDDFEKVIVHVPEIDLALRKFISAVGDTAYDRAPSVDTSELRQGAETAIYNHSKVPVQVEIGDVVTYTIRLYNEGEVSGRVSQVTDYLDSHLKYVPFGDDTNGDWWSAVAGDGYTIVTSTNNCIVVNVGGNTDTSYVGGKLSDAIIPAYDPSRDVLSYVDIEIHCQVMATEGTTKLTNIAEITGQTDEEGTPVDSDRDSTPGNVDLPEDFPGYKDDEIGKDYIPGQQDDDDFEKVVVVVPEVDLALRKFISAVDGETLTGDASKEPVVDTTPLDNKTDTTAIYNHSKLPITVKKGSLVTYTIRVYNEGEVDAYVSEITDYLPEYLIYLPENETNIRYGWTYNEETRQVKTTITAEGNTAGDAIYQNRTNGKLLLKYDGDSTLDYIDVQIICKVDEKAEGNHILTNLAQITEIRDKDGNELQDDKDSVPDGNFDLPNEEEKPTYKEEESNKPYVPGQEDDDDFDKVLVKPTFDLALRKFITGVGTTSVNNRYPQVSYENGDFTYTHTKEPIELVTGDVVTYTIRVYNEGETDGYANEITDDVPEGLEFLPENETNIEYRWVMLDENQEETNDVTKAKYIITDYLSEEQEEATGRNNLIKAFNEEEGVTETNPDYKDVKIAFKVTYKATTKDDTARTIINTAQISADSDDDEDSTPNRDEVYNHDGDNEDDIDYDQVKVKYFDLSLLKWVGQTIVTLNGKTTTTDTGHTAETSRNEDPVKIEIKASDVKKINIKYVYTIRITNEGEIAGYAQEITDYIPEGLKFVQEDNPDWYEISEGVVGTAALENTLLQPGESAEVKITLTWINGTENFGEKVNLAEISKDYNESGSPDVDSTPNNKVPDEDDIDDAPVILAVKTGIAQTYIGLVLIILVTFAGGIGLIKKYVLE